MQVLGLLTLSSFNSRAHSIKDFSQIQTLNGFQYFWLRSKGSPPFSLAPRSTPEQAGERFLPPIVTTHTQEPQFWEFANETGKEDLVGQYSQSPENVWGILFVCLFVC